MWKGMIVGLAIQSVMAPFNLYENPLVQAVLLRGGFSGLKEKRIFGEKIREEMNDDDNVTDEQGNTIVLKSADSKKDNGRKKSFEDVVLDTWDLGEEADVAPFMSAMTKSNVNNVTKENAWSPIMVLSGLGAAGVGDALKKMKDLGANPEIVDKEGWNALHWVSSVILRRVFFSACYLILHTISRTTLLILTTRRLPSMAVPRRHPLYLMKKVTMESH